MHPEVRTLQRVLGGILVVAGSSGLLHAYKLSNLAPTVSVLMLVAGLYAVGTGIILFPKVQDVMEKRFDIRINKRILGALALASLAALAFSGFLYLKVMKFMNTVFL